MKIVGNLVIAAIASASLCAPVMAGEATSDGALRAPNLNFYHMPGVDQVPASTAHSSAMAGAQAGPYGYVFLAGSAFTPRASSMTVTYGAAGCINFDGLVNTDLQLPDGAVITGVRAFYKNMDPSGSVRTSITSYDGAGNYSDLVLGTSTQNSGYASEHFALSNPETVDNYARAYVVTATTIGNASFCGARIFYTAP